MNVDEIVGWDGLPSKDFVESFRIIIMCKVNYLIPHPFSLVLLVSLKFETLLSFSNLAFFFKLSTRKKNMQLQWKIQDIRKVLLDCQTHCLAQKEFWLLEFFDGIEDFWKSIIKTFLALKNTSRLKHLILSQSHPPLKSKKVVKYWKYQGRNLKGN